MDAPPAPSREHPRSARDRRGHPAERARPVRERRERVAAVKKIEPFEQETPVVRHRVGRADGDEREAHRVGSAM